jgi:hypothetical protein
VGEWRYSSTHSLTSALERWVVSFTIRPFCPQGKSYWYPLDRRLGGPQSRSGRGGEEKNSQPLLYLHPLKTTSCRSSWISTETALPYFYLKMWQWRQPMGAIPQVIWKIRKIARNTRIVSESSWMQAGKCMLQGTGGVEAEGHEITTLFSRLQAFLIANYRGRSKPWHRITARL